MDPLLLMAVLPAAWLLRYIYRLDPVEKEPARLLTLLLALGALACFPAMALETVGMETVLGGKEPATYVDLLIENFFIIALSEEACKMLFLRWRTWNHDHFNFVFDGIVYAVFVSLGFAILENIGYVYQFGMGTAVVRAVTAIPGHAIFGVFMGCFYGLEKLAAVEGKQLRRIAFAVLSLLVPVLCHGFYDFAASVDSDVFLGAFFAFLLLLIFVAARLVKWMAVKAHPIMGIGQPAMQGTSAYPAAYPAPPASYVPPAQAGYGDPVYPTSTYPTSALTSTEQQLPVHPYNLHWYYGNEIPSTRPVDESSKPVNE